MKFISRKGGFYMNNIEKEESQELEAKDEIQEEFSTNTIDKNIKKNSKKKFITILVIICIIVAIIIGIYSLITYINKMNIEAKKMVYLLQM